AHRALPSFPTRRSSDLRQDRPDAHDGVRWAEDDGRSLAQGIADLGGGAGVIYPFEANACNGVGVMAAHEVVLKTERALRGLDQRSEEHTSELQSRVDLV